MPSYKVPGSYRDPSSHVYLCDNRVFRGIKADQAEVMKTFLSSSLFEKHNGTNLVSTKISNEKSLKSAGLPSEVIANYDLWLEHEKLKFLTFPYEWSFAQLKSAAIFHLKFQISALNAGYQIKDASAYNIQFVGTNPIFIDLPSFELYEDGQPWVAYKQFCEHFLAPLMLQHYTGLDSDKIYRSYPDGLDLVTCSKLFPMKSYFNLSALGHIHMQALAARKISSTSSQDGSSEKTISVKKQNLFSMLRSLLAAVRKLKNKNASYWREYEKQNSYSTETMAEKDQIIADFVQKNKIKTMIDLGCNAGKFSEIALNNGAEHVIGMDIDGGALDIAMERFSERAGEFSPVLFDMVNPAPALGWSLKERASIYERLPKMDGIVCLAVIHHIVIAKNVPMQEFIDTVLSLAPKGIIEFVMKDDPMVQGLLANRDDIFADYTPEHFENCLKNNAKFKKLDGTNQTRVFYQYETV